MPAEPFFDYSQYDYDNPVVALEEIQSYNPQRHEMAQLTGIVWVDPEQHALIGFKDVRDDEFWVRGHMPGYPLLPGVLQCEAAAQLAGFYARKYDILEAGDFLGFGGMNNVRFRGQVPPGKRLIICARATRIRKRRLSEFEFQGFVDDRMVFDGMMIGVPISRDSE